MHALLVKAGTGAAALAACAASMLGTASSAVADDAPQVSISIQSPATLIAHGVAVDVPVVVSCSTDGGQASVNISLSQAIGKRIATGLASLQVTCTGQSETLLARVFSLDVAFSKGNAAVAQGGIISCNSIGCGQAVDSQTIRIK